MYEAEQTVSDSSEELHCSYQMTIIVLALKKTLVSVKVHLSLSFNNCKCQFRIISLIDSYK